jgi:hypothetical protein
MAGKKNLSERRHSTNGVYHSSLSTYPYASKSLKGNSVRHEISLRMYEHARNHFRRSADNYSWRSWLCKAEDLGKSVEVHPRRRAGSMAQSLHDRQNSELGKTLSHGCGWAHCRVTFVAILIGQHTIAHARRNVSFPPPRHRSQALPRTSPYTSTVHTKTTRSIDGGPSAIADG